MDPGFRFRPSVQELIDVLEFKSRGGGDVSQILENTGDITEMDLYGEVDKEPWKILRNVNEWGLVSDPKKKATYVVTRLPKMGDNKVARKSGQGTWVGKTQPTTFEKDGEEIVTMKSLSYVYYGRNSEAAGACYYYLHEYYLSEAYLKKIGAVGSDLVICRIIRDTAKPCRRGYKNVSPRNSKRRRVDSPASFSRNATYSQGDSVLQEPPACNNTGHLVLQEPPAHNYASDRVLQEPPAHNYAGDMVLQEPPGYNYAEFTENPCPSGQCVDYQNPMIHQEYSNDAASSMVLEHNQDSGNLAISRNEDYWMVESYVGMLEDCINAAPSTETAGQEMENYTLQDAGHFAGLDAADMDLLEDISRWLINEN